MNLIITVSIPRPDSCDAMSMTEIAMLKRPKSLTVSCLEIINTDMNPRNAAKIFPVKTGVRCVAKRCITRSFMWESFRDQTLTLNSFIVKRFFF